MIERKSPKQSATLYKVGTKKKGNDGNIWIIVENKNKVKRWQLYKKPSIVENKKIRLEDIPIENLYEKVYFKKNNWDKWLENSNNELKSFINKIRKSYIEFKKLKLKVIEVIEPPSKQAYWVEQYPSDYAKQKYPEYNNKPHIILRFKIDFNFHLHTEYNQICIEAYINNMSNEIKEKLIKYLDKNYQKQYLLKLIVENDYSLNLCLKNLAIKL
jgi:hypothetical protein